MTKSRVCTFLCQRMDIPAYPWLGDVGPTSRKKFFADPYVVLITPGDLVQDALSMDALRLLH